MNIAILTAALIEPMLPLSESRRLRGSYLTVDSSKQWALTGRSPSLISGAVGAPVVDFVRTCSASAVKTGRRRGRWAHNPLGYDGRDRIILVS